MCPVADQGVFILVFILVAFLDTSRFVYSEKSGLFEGVQRSHFGHGCICNVQFIFICFPDMGKVRYHAGVLKSLKEHRRFNVSLRRFYLMISGFLR